MSIPATVHGKRRNGRTYQWDDYLPADLMGMSRTMVSQNYTAAEQRKRVKEQVLSHLGEYRTADPRIVRLGVSGEQWLYDDSQDWRISTLTSQLDGAGQPDTEALTRVKMNAPRQLVNAASLPFDADLFCDEAWEEKCDKLCVCRQIASLTKRSLLEVCNCFDNVFGADGWRDVGLRGDGLKKYAVLNGHPFFFIARGILIHLCEPKEKTQRALACVCDDGHAYFLKSARTVSQWEVKDEFRTDVKLLMRNENRTLVPLIAEWNRWDGTPKAGHTLISVSHRSANNCWNRAGAVR